MRDCGKQFNRKHGLAQHLQAAHRLVPAAEASSPQHSASSDGGSSTTTDSSHGRREAEAKKERREGQEERQRAEDAVNPLFAAIPRYPVAEPSQPTGPTTRLPVPPPTQPVTLPHLVSVREQMRKSVVVYCSIFRGNGRGV